MSITTYNSAYFDDFNVADSDGLTPADKNYLRILFKPGRSVQARELNQAQSILQTQIDRLGLGLFKPNSVIVGRPCNFDTTLIYVDVTVSAEENTTFQNIVSDLSLVVLSQGNTKAVITKIEVLDGTSYRLFCQYREGSTFNLAEAAIEATENDIQIATISLSITEIGNAVSATIENSIYFVNGCMAVAREQYQAIAIEKNDFGANLSFNGAVVLDVTESIIDNITDDTLLDNANGSPNFAGIGADRYKIDLQLKIVKNEDLLKPEGANYIVLLRIKDTNVIREENSIDNSGSNLEKILARRTYEESGDYTVKDFPVDILEVLGETYTSRYKNVGDLPQGLGINNAREKFACTIGPSVAYVKGSRVELLSANTIIGDKARSTWLSLNGYHKQSGMAATLGTYVEGSLTKSLPDIDSFNAVYTLFNDTTTTIVGTCKIQTVEIISNNLFRLYLHSITGNPNFENVSKIVANGLDFEFILSPSTNKLKDIHINSSLYTFPHTEIKTVKDLRVTEKIRFAAQTVTTLSRNVTFSAAGKIIDSSPNNLIVSQKVANTYTLLSYASSAPGDDKYTINSTNDGTLSLTIGGTTDADISIMASVTSNISETLGVKRLVTENITITSATVAINTTFDVPGAYHVVSINNPAWELIEDGQHPGEYRAAKIKSKLEFTGTEPKTVSVTHWKFIGNGNYYTVNSYQNSSGGAVELDDIPFFNNQRLCDVLDARLRPGLNDRLALDPYSAISAEIDFYLPRRDILCVNSAGEFYILQGQGNVSPNLPKIDEDTATLALYNLFIPAYTFSANDIQITRVDNRRFTMRDIGNIEKRIGTLEYYTSLSLLEKSVNDKSVFDADGTARFKNGFITDGFRNHTVGNIADVNYRCSIDKERGRLYPYHSGYSVPLKIESDAVFKNQKNIMLKHSEISVDYLEQNLATQFISLQPHEIISSQGSLEINPEVDTWTDQKTNPPRNIELFPGLDNILTELGTASGLLGTDWDGNWLTTSTQRINRRTQGINQIDTGTNTTFVTEDINTSLGRFISDVSIKPYMRSRVIRFRCEALKNNTQYFVYFDGQDITSYVSVYGGTDNILNQDPNVDDGLDEATLLQKYPPTSSLFSNAVGLLQGYIIVPNNEVLKFASGEKTIKITNSPRNIEDESTSEAEARFISNGLGVTTNETIVSTSLPRINRQAVTRTRQLRRRRDPIAQTFTVEDETGIFASSIEVYFAGKPPSTDNNIGVLAYLVNVINGYPSSEVIPGSEVNLPYDQVVTSNDSSRPTKFKFSSPVYLNPQTEYAVILFSESSDYTAYIAEMGGTKRDLLTGQIISNQPAVGVFFTSSNKTTWSAAQNRDLKFKLYRANFDITNVNVNATPFVGSGLQGISIPEDADNTGWSTNGTTVIVEAPTLAIIDSDGELTTQPVVGGVTATATATVNPNNESITAINIVRTGFGYTSPPNVTITSGQKSVTVQGVLQTTKVAACNLNQKNINFIGKTNVVPKLTLGGTIYNITPGVPIEDITNINYTIDANNASQTQLTLSLSSTDSRLSPVIDLHSLSLQTREYLISNSQTDESLTSRYFTKEVFLTNPADQLDIYLDVNRPTSTSNIKVYGQFKDNNGNVIGSEWQIIEPLAPREIPINSNRDIFSEVRFNVNPLNDFASFIVKIVFVGTNYTDVATVKDFRAIASI